MPVRLACIGGDDFEPTRIRRSDRRKRRQAALVLLDRHDARGAFEQKRTREPAGARSHLDHVHAFERAGGARDAAREIKIEQEVLA